MRKRERERERERENTLNAFGYWLERSVFILVMADSTFDALANIPGHMSSFSASAQDGSLVNVKWIDVMKWGAL
jgi:hypothetical protein